MNIFEKIAEFGHEQVVFCHDPKVGYRGIIAIHSTVLGPAVGGTRFRPYPSDEEALVDALRLSRGMTYKTAVAGLNVGDCSTSSPTNSSTSSGSHIASRASEMGAKGVRHVFAKRMEPPSAPRLTEKVGQKKGGFSGKNFFCPTFSVSLVWQAVHAQNLDGHPARKGFCPIPQPCAKFVAAV